MKRILSAAICALMFTSLLPASVLAAPVTIEGLAEGNVYYADLLKDVEVSADADSVELYVNGVLLEKKDAGAAFDLSGVTGSTNLKAVAYDAADHAVGQTELNISAYNLILSDYVDCNFNAMEEKIPYEDAYSFPESSAIVGRNEIGYYGVKKVDEEHGKSVVLGLDNGDKDPWSQGGAWVGVSGKDIAGGVMIYSADIYVEACDNYELYLRGSTGSITTADVKFTRDGLITFAGSKGSGPQSIPYEAKTWYRVEYVIDMTNKTYSFVIDGEPVALSYDMTNQNYDILNNIRVVAPNRFQEKTFIALDNLTVKSTTVVPYIQSIAPVSYDAEYIDITWSAAVNPASLNVGTVSLNRENYVEAVETSGAATRIRLKNRLLSNTAYTVQIAAGTELIAGQPAIPNAMAAVFTSGKAPLEITAGSACFKNGVFVCSVESTKAADQDVYVMETVWSGQTLERVHCTKQTVKAGTVTPVSVQVNRAAGETSSVYILESFENAAVISNQVFTNAD